MKKMKLNKILMGAMFLAMGAAGYGASIDHIQNYTPEYNTNPALNGAINPGTSAYYIKKVLHWFRIYRNS